MKAPADLVAFIERERPRLVRAVHVLVGDRAVAEEIVQEAMLRSASRWERVGGLASPGGWTHRVALNLATSQLRRWQAERRARARLDPSSHAVPDSETAVEVRRGLAALPLPTRRLLVQRYILDWDVDQVAEAEGIRRDAARQRLHRARAALRAELDPQLVPDASFDRTSATQEATDAR